MDSTFENFTSLIRSINKRQQMSDNEIHKQVLNRFIETTIIK